MTVLAQILNGSTGLDARDTLNQALRHFAGVLYVEDTPGIVIGAGQTSAVRQANGTALNALLASTGTGQTNAGKRIMWHMGLLEVEGVTLTLPTGTGGFYGSMQFSRILSFSDMDLLKLGAGPGTLIGSVVFDGLRIGYGVAAPNSVGFLMGAAFLNTYRNLCFDKFLSGVIRHPKMSWNHVASTTFFSCVCENIQLGGGTQNIMRRTVDGTGNVWNNVYLGGGNPSERTTLTQAALYLQGFHQDTWNQLNIEWTSSPADVVFLDNVRSFVMSSLHFEGNKTTGSGNAGQFRFSLSSGSVTGLEVFNHVHDATDYTGTPCFASNFFGIMVEFENVEWRRDTALQDKSLQIFRFDTTAASTIGMATYFRMRNFRFVGTSPTMQFDERTGTADVGLSPNGACTSFGSYTFDPVMSAVDQPLYTLPAGNGSINAYGVNRRATFVVSQPITADKAIRLKTAMRAGSGVGSLVNRAAGDTISIDRTSAATGAFNVVVYADDATTVITTIAFNASGSRTFLLWNGTTWVVVT